jgi:outer membrane protein OmpA-like peptidoglycan-associated protein
MKKFTLIIILTLVSVSAFSQRAIIRRADRMYNTLAYSDAIPLYEYLLKRDSTRITPMRKLADCYRLTSNTKKSEYWYSRLVNNDVQVMSKFYYAEALLKNGKYSEARTWFTNPAVTAMNDPRVADYLKSLDDLDMLMNADTASVKIRKLGFNNSESDYAPVILNNDIVFASSRTYSNWVKRSHSWTDEKFVSLFISSNDDDYASIAPYAPELRTKFNTGPVAFNKDHTLMYYTVNNPKKKSAKGFKNLRILTARYEKNKWKKTAAFPYNSMDYANAHPALSEDGKTLYFVSDRPGGFGGMDIYRCTLKEDMTWDAPVNMGAIVNSVGDELFPFVSDEGRLYFASNGHGGLGGLDLFSYDLASNAQKVENLGGPLNSSEDDFGLVMFPGSVKGFFSSDRGNNGINDDIYSFVIQQGRGYKIYVVDSLSGELIAGSSIKVTSPDIIDPVVPASETGRFSVLLDKEKLFTVYASADQYQAKTQPLESPDANSVFVVKLAKINRCSLQGTVTNKDTGEKIDSALVIITDRTNNKVVLEFYTGKDGMYKYEDVTKGSVYEIKITKDRFFSAEGLLNAKDAVCGVAGARDMDYVRDLQMAPIVIGKAIKIENIYFDLNKWNIRKDAAVELDKIVTLMNENPDIIIELGSHTDARGSDASNMTLSDKRAKSSAAYIISKGISENRIKGKGYGESMLVNECGNGVTCTEEEHQQNRRTEFKVTGFLK